MSISRKGQFDQLLITAISFCVFLACFVSIGTFGEKLSPLGDRIDGVQQVVAIACWAIAGCLSAIIAGRTGIRPPPLICASFYVFALASGFWAADVSDGLSKGAVLFLIATMVWLSSMTLSVAQFIFMARRATVLLCLISFPVAILRPDIGVNEGYVHAGAWQGVFSSKQSLGIAGALVIFATAAQMFSVRRRRPKDLLATFAYLAIGLIACFVSGSRGAGIVAAISIICVLIGRRYIALMRLVAFVPLVAFAIATTMIFWLVSTGDREFYVAGTVINFTQRTYIWSHALENWTTRPILGFGINGFWTLDSVSNAFYLANDWVLHNFHSGYVAILTELGLVGFLIFFVFTFDYCIKSVKMIQLRSADPLTLLLCLGTPIIIYTLDITETFFGRATNFLHCIFIFMFLSTARLSKISALMPPTRGNV